MRTKPKSAYSLTHTIIWDSLYCYSRAIGPGLHDDQVLPVIGKALFEFGWPCMGPAIVRIFEANDVVDVQV